MKELVKLDLSSFKKAIGSLTEAINEFEKDKSNLFIRDAIIQRFEYTYELAHKMLKRYIAITSANVNEIDQMSFATLIRTGAEKGLLQNSWDIWATYRNARNLTSHTYNEKNAIEVCQIIPQFINDIKFLLDQLQKRTVIV